ncbi:MAG: sigma-70 family RNA polymerase sigma factor [Planctomycetes bacterium]|nr:sigma-70 family RNA polymerase sigma factor [Planctomycetota bacterium]
MDSGKDRTRTEDLLAKHLRGDRGAEFRLFDRQRASLLEHARRHPLMSRLSALFSAEDLVHECLLRVLDRRVLARFEDRGAGSLRGLLVTILDRVMKDESRRASARKRGGAAGSRARADGDRPAELDLAGGREPSPTVAARAAEIEDLCRRVLPPSDFEVWRSFELVGSTSEEIARRIGSTPGAVRSRVRRIRERLVRELAVLVGSPPPR